MSSARVGDSKSGGGIWSHPSWASALELSRAWHLSHSAQNSPVFDYYSGLVSFIRSQITINTARRSSSIDSSMSIEWRYSAPVSPNSTEMPFPTTPYGWSSRSSLSCNLRRLKFASSTYLSYFAFDTRWVAVGYIVGVTIGNFTARKINFKCHQWTYYLCLSSDFDY